MTAIFHLRTDEFLRSGSGIVDQVEDIVLFGH